MYVAKKKALIVQLICAFVFAHAKGRFSHDAGHLIGLKTDTIKFKERSLERGS